MKDNYKYVGNMNLYEHFLFYRNKYCQFEKYSEEIAFCQRCRFKSLCSIQVIEITTIIHEFKEQDKTCDMCSRRDMCYLQDESACESFKL